jgi:hypothetical protein
MNSNTSQIFESYVPVYDTVPESWDQARPFLVEQLKLLANTVNAREIGYFLDEELLSGKQFIPSANNPTGEQQQFRSVLRKVIDVSPLVAGANVFAHGITVDSNFTLVDLWVAATASSTPRAQLITDANVWLDATNINITSPLAFDRAFCVIEYLQEI